MKQLLLLFLASISLCDSSSQDLSDLDEWDYIPEN